MEEGREVWGEERGRRGRWKKEGRYGERREVGGPVWREERGREGMVQEGRDEGTSREGGEQRGVKAFP